MMTRRILLVVALVATVVFGFRVDAEAYKRHRIFNRVDSQATFGAAIGCETLAFDLYARDFRRWIDGEPDTFFTASWLLEGAGCDFADGGDSTSVLVLTDTRDTLLVQLTGARGVYFYDFRRTGRLRRVHYPDDVPGNCKNKTRTVTEMDGEARLKLPPKLGGVLVSTSAAKQNKHRNVVRNNAGPGGPC
jgi:hypothetical protein